MNIQQVKALVRSIIQSAPETLTVQQLNRDFHEEEGSYVPYKDHGHNSLESFLGSMPDTCVVIGTGPNAKVFATASEKSGHIQELVARQNKSKKRRSRPNGSCNVNMQRNHSSRHITNKFVSPQTRHQPKVTFPPPETSSFLPQRTSQRIPPLMAQPVMAPYMPPVSWQMMQVYQNQCQLAVAMQTHLFQQQKQQYRPNYTTPKQPSQRKVDSKPQAQQQYKINNSEQKIIPQQRKVENQQTQLKPPQSSQQNRQQKINQENQQSQQRQEISTEVHAQKTEAEQIIHSLKSLNISGTQSTNCSEQNPKITKNSLESYKNEAIPDYAVNDLVFRLDFPNFTVKYGEQIRGYSVPSDVQVGATIGLFISEIHNPFKFWFHFYKENHELDVLMNNMERFYTSLDADELKLPHKCITPGQVCAALFKNLWHRAEIVSHIVDNKVKVYFADYGTIWVISKEDIKYLAVKFSYLPKQALRGCLSHIKPKKLHWSYESSVDFLSLVYDKMLYAKISEIDHKRGVFYMIIGDTNDENNLLQINSELVNKGHAVFDESWQTDRIKEVGVVNMH